MSFVETETNGQIFTIRLNRPERLNALALLLEKEWLKLLQSFIMIII